MFKKTIIGATFVANAGMLSAYPSDIYNAYNTPASTGYYSYSDYTFRGCGAGCSQPCAYTEENDDQSRNYPSEGRMSTMRARYQESANRNDNRSARDNDQPEMDVDQEANDTSIASDVRDALDNDRSLSNPRNIEVTVNVGVVTLKGNVQSESEKSRAESDAKNVDGVDSVNNNLNISNP